MSKIGRILMLITALGVFSIFALVVRADVGEPGSESDPIVTKSYVDKIIMSMKEYVDSKANNSTESLEIVYLQKGESLVAGKGTEIILRSGRATIIDSIGGGISDLTAGKDLKAGEKVVANHLLLVPRDDGRGVAAQTDVVLVVRGDFHTSK